MGVLQQARGRPAARAFQGLQLPADRLEPGRGAVGQTPGILDYGQRLELRRKVAELAPKGLKDGKVLHGRSQLSTDALRRLQKGPDRQKLLSREEAAALRPLEEGRDRGESRVPGYLPAAVDEVDPAPQEGGALFELFEGPTGRGSLQGAHAELAPQPLPEGREGLAELQKLEDGRSCNHNRFSVSLPGRSIRDGGHGKDVGADRRADRRMKGDVGRRRLHPPN